MGDTDIERDDETVAVGLREYDGEAERDRRAEVVPDNDDVRHVDTVPVRQALLDGVLEETLDPDGHDEGLRDRIAEADKLGLEVIDCEFVVELLTDTEAVDRGLLVGELETERDKVPVGETDIVFDLVDEPVNVPVTDPEAVSERVTDGLREDDVLPDGLTVSEDEADGDNVGDGLCVALEEPVEDPESLTLPVELADELELCVDVAEAEDDLVALELSEELDVDDSRVDTVAEAVPDVEPVAVAVADDD